MGADEREHGGRRSAEHRPHYQAPAWTIAKVMYNEAAQRLELTLEVDAQYLR